MLNAGFGESIVLELPDGAWGVVDCYTPSETDPSANPTLAFLRERGIDVLEFVCLTHPHADHFRGLRHLLQSLTVRWYWQPAAVSAKELIGYLWRDAAERGASDPLAALLQVVREKATNENLRLERLSGVQHLRSADAGGVGLDIHGIAPSGRHIERYQRELARCLGPDGRLVARLPPQRHNGISAALAIRYGETRVILGGDVEAEGWEDVMEAPACPPLGAHGVKVSHHGSATGFCPGLWTRFAAGGRPVSVVTPSRVHRLPRAEGLVEIQKHSSRVLATCLAAVPPPWGSGQEGTESGGGAERSAVETLLPSFRRAASYPLGICTLTFDHQGDCEVQHRGAAGELISSTAATKA